MIGMNEINRILSPIKNRIFNLIGRGYVTRVNNTVQVTGKATQKIQVEALEDEIITDIERVQEYGLETYPYERHGDSGQHADTEAVIGFLNGNRDQGLILIIGDRYYRLTDLSQGEVALYTFKDKDSGNHRIHLKNDRTIEIKASSVTINCNVTISSGSLSVSGSLSASGDVSDSKSSMDDMRTTYNLHTHSHGDPTTGPPGVLMT